MTEYCSGRNYSAELECAICLDSWKEPVEVVPCGHIFCEVCVKSVSKCPVCRSAIQSTRTPNRTLVNLALQVTVSCKKCNWVGTREQSVGHVCGSQVASAATSSSSVVFPGSNTYNPSGSYFVQQHSAASSLANYQQPSCNSGSGNGAPQSGVARSQHRYSVIEPTGRAPWERYQLSQDEYDQIVSLFVFFDADDSGELSRQEVGRLAHWLNFARTNAEVDRIFADMDFDGSGSLSLGEFLTWLCYNKPNPQALYGLTQSQYNTVLMQFHTYDSNQDGYLTINEFTNLVIRLGDVRTPTEAQALFRAIDSDHSGTVDLHEFLLFRSRQSRR